MSETAEHIVEQSHPAAGRTLTGAEIIVQVLADEGVETVFGYSGGAILPTYDAIFRFNESQNAAMPLVVPANEQGAGFMAAGYARATGKVGAAIVTSGPGATNTVTPVRDCMADSVPMVLITGQVARAAIGTDAFQEAPVANIMSPVAKHVFMVTDPEQLEATVRTAFEIARSGRPGPVVIDVPKDVQTQQNVFRGSGVLPVPGYRQRMQALRDNKLSSDKCRAFFELFEASQRPLIYAGGGVINAGASQALRDFAHRFELPVVTTLMGIGALDTSDPLCLHMLGMHGTAYANYAVEDCDLLIAIGARFDDRVAGVPSQFAPSARAIAHLDADASEINKVKAVDWHHVGLFSESITQLTLYGQKHNVGTTPSAWHEHLTELRQTYPMNYDQESDLIQPPAVMQAINRQTNGNAVVATGVGQHQMWSAQYCQFREPRLWLTSGSMGTMGFGLPAAIGAAFARPDRQVIDIDGDASIRMNIGELETATTYDLPVKVLVINNNGDGMVKQWQKLFFMGRLSASDKSLHKKDFIKAAEADGFKFAQRLSDPAALDDTIEKFLAFDGPAFLEVEVDPDAGVYPMVGPGKTYSEMITGDYIATRGE